MSTEPRLSDSDVFRADLAEAQRLIREGDVEAIAAFLSRDVKARAKRAAQRARGTLTIEVRAGDVEMVVSWAAKGLQLTEAPMDHYARGSIDRIRRAVNDAAREQQP